VAAAVVAAAVVAAAVVAAAVVAGTGVDVLSPQALSSGRMSNPNAASIPNNRLFDLIVSSLSTTFGFG
jgi:hypothetical protein